MDNNSSYAVFNGTRLLAIGPLEEVLRLIKSRSNPPAGQTDVLIFHEETGRPVDFDLRGSIEEVVERAVPKLPKAGPGRPRLGVVSREVSLLPRHWEWLESQQSGASAAIRRLIDERRKREPVGSEVTRKRIDAVGRVMTVMAGNLPGFEEAYRALYARDAHRLWQEIDQWPPDIKAYVRERTSSLVAETPAGN